ncbi:MAG: histidine kinase, partial [Bacteroidales bacterium]
NTGEVIIAKYQKNRLKIKYRFQAGTEIVGNAIKFLVVDHSSHLFVGTNLGLNRIDLKSLYFENKMVTNFYDTETGYYDHSGNTAICDKKGNIWVGTDIHLLKIDAELLNGLSAQTPRIKFTGLDVNYQPDSDIDFNIANKFSHSNNNLIIHFAALNYLNPDQTLYRYKLGGLSNKWSEYTTDSKAIFTSLNPGKYRFVVETYNRINNSRIGSIVFSFRISPPWYLNWLFITAVVLFLVFCIYQIIRFRTNQVRTLEERKSEFTRQLATIEMRALQSQMNPHFIFNCINSIQGFILKNKIDEALGYLMDFAKILRQTLENASKEYISLEEELQYIQYYLSLELMRFDQKFRVEIVLPEDINTQNIQIPPMIIQPHVENAIRHGLLHKQVENGLLTIKFSTDNGIFNCIIEDNGVGRQKSREIESWKQHSHKPQSTRITQDRIDLLNKSTQSDKYRVTISDLHSDIGEGTGTRVDIMLPLITL